MLKGKKTNRFNFIVVAQQSMSCIEMVNIYYIEEKIV